MAADTLSPLGSFTAGASAACMAVVVTNPLELVKTRLQLQGELQAKGGPKIYKGLLQSLGLIYRQEGIRGLQRGLGPAFVYQIALNGTRVGLYEPVRREANMLLGLDPNQQFYGVSIAVATITGVAGAALGSPFYLIKTRMQSYSPTLAVGTQTHYTSTWDGLKALYKAGGIRGMYRGVGAAMLRTGAGSSVQLPIYTASKNFFLAKGIFKDGSPLYIASSVVAGLGVAVVMNPFDVIMTRMYNQKGNLYTGILDCFVKTIRYEGPTALYKGFVAQAMRVGPHTVLVLTFMEQTTRFMKWVEGIPA